MTKDEIKVRLSEIDDKIQRLNIERDELLDELRKLISPPALGISVSDGIGAEDKFGG